MVTKTIKQMLIDLHREERERMRCTLVHELKKESEKLTLPYENNIKVIQKELSILENKMSILRQQINEQRNMKDKDLKTAKLSVFAHTSCGDAVHERLLEFDKTTNDSIREILEK